MIKMSAPAECDLMMAGLLELIACFACTICLKSAASWFVIRLSMEVRSDVGNRWQCPSVDRYRLVVLSVFNVFLLLSISQLKKKFDKRRLIFIFMLEGTGALDLNFCWFQDGKSLIFNCTCGVFPRDFSVTVCHQIYSSAISWND